MITMEKKELNEREIQDIINNVCQGNVNDFEQIYDVYYKMVTSIIRRIVKPNTTELDSIVNEAFLIIFKGLKGFKGNSKFSTYIYRIVLNYAFKVSKKKNRERKYFVVWGDNNDSNSIENIASPTKIEDVIVDKNFLENTIGSLTKELQEAIDLYYYERYSIREIANIVGTTETAIKNRLYQARNKIKNELKKREVL
ncbi:MAG: sigma-70 family RNA polymerase sigma factor [Spirochaetota bacterium]|nr:sigma-70 family RNA polymerase sigma factor [Spirochaetota bacterium]